MRIPSCLIVLLFATALAGCSDATKKTPPPTATAPAPAAPAMPPPTAPPAAPDMPPPLLPHELKAAFIADAAKTYGLSTAEVEGWLAQAAYRQSIVDAMSRPAESVKPWKDYRPIFMTDARIQQGRAFYQQNREQLLKVQAQTGVPAEYIVAIIGVETSYGRITGSYRVLDALYTLGFYYPASGRPDRVDYERNRGKFFRDQLAQAIVLAKENGLDLATLKGSYAGAMGWGQFMPSSYRDYAKDGDGDGRRDLFTDLPDVFASIANYFVAFGWQSGLPPFVPATADAGATPFVPENFESKYTLADLAARGYRPVDPTVPAQPVTLLTLEGDAGPEYWIGYKNFYVITRYNRSPMYAMAVHQLAREIAAGAGPAAAP
jgi:membrane-bound lytic murein transglycosylase B